MITFLVVFFVTLCMGSLFDKMTTRGQRLANFAVFCFVLIAFWRERNWQSWEFWVGMCLLIYFYLRPKDDPSK